MGKLSVRPVGFGGPLKELASDAAVVEREWLAGKRSRRRVRDQWSSRSVGFREWACRHETRLRRCRCGRSTSMASVMCRMATEFDEAMWLLHVSVDGQAGREEWREGVRSDGLMVGMCDIEVEIPLRRMVKLRDP